VRSELDDESDGWNWIRINAKDDFSALEMNASGCNVNVNGFVSDESAVEHLDDWIHHLSQLRRIDSSESS
jgi:hypothetical protein